VSLSEFEEIRETPTGLLIIKLSISAVSSMINPLEWSSIASIGLMISSMAYTVPVKSDFVAPACPLTLTFNSIA
ncbi:hypothetical protein PENTCL1PPCAC_7751, partial [Pristionchus entomophagus]